jgi:hypothetical protein
MGYGTLTDKHMLSSRNAEAGNGGPRPFTKMAAVAILEIIEALQINELSLNFDEVRYADLVEKIELKHHKNKIV